MGQRQRGTVTTGLHDHRQGENGCKASHNAGGCVQVQYVEEAVMGM